jgi:hypothetical protein
MLGSVSDIDTGSGSYDQIAPGDAGGSSNTDPLTIVEPVTSAPQPLPKPEIADEPLGGATSNIFQARHADVRSANVGGIDNSASSDGNMALWFRLRVR